MAATDTRRRVRLRNAVPQTFNTQRAAKLFEAKLLGAWSCVPRPALASLSAVMIIIPARTS
jgi:hypothetical protein